MTDLLALLWYGLWPWPILFLACASSCLVLFIVEGITRRRLLALLGYRVAYGLVRRYDRGLRWLAAWARIAAVSQWIANRAYSRVPAWAVLLGEGLLRELPLPELDQNGTTQRRARIAQTLRDIYAPAPLRWFTKRCKIANECGSRALFFACELAWTTGDTGPFEEFRDRLQQLQSCPASAPVGRYARLAVVLVGPDPVAAVATAEQFYRQLTRSPRPQGPSGPRIIDTPWPDSIQQWLPWLRFHWRRHDYLALAAAGHQLVDHVAGRGVSEITDATSTTDGTTDHTIDQASGKAVGKASDKASARTMDRSGAGSIEACRDVYALMAAAYAALAADAVPAGAAAAAPRAAFYRTVADDMAAMTQVTGRPRFVSSTDECPRRNRA